MFTSEIWRKCFPSSPERCAACPGDKRCVGGDGRLGTPYFFVGEAPGQDEDENSGRPFTGRAGLEFNTHYLPLAGLTREDIYLTNTRKCRPPNNRKPSPEEIAVCGGTFLPIELEAVNPDLVVLMGGTASSLSPAIDLETHNGIPQLVELFDSSYLVIPTYHPALGLHDGGKIRTIREGFFGIKKFLESGYMGEEDAYAGKEQYEEISGNNWEQHLDADLLSIDTEGDMWSWQATSEQGRGIIGWPGREGLAILQVLLDTAKHITIHHSLHDVAVLEAKFAGVTPG